MKNRLKIDKRRTIAAFPGYAAAVEPGLYTHMFIEDVYGGFIGLRHVTADQKPRVEVKGDEAAKAVIGAICTSLSDDSGYDLADTVMAAIRAIATRLAWFGKAVYEICGSGTEVTLESVTPFRLYRVPGGFIQLVPKKERQWVGDIRYTFLPASSAWAIRLPRRLSGPQGYRRLLKHLRNVSRSAPTFWTEELKRGKIATEFSVSDYNRMRDAYISRVTKLWGWNRRDSSGTHDTEFFYFFRSLRFRQAQAVLRNHIVTELNEFFLRCGVHANIQLQGFAAETEIEELIKRALEGSLHYAEALRAAS